MVFSQLTFRVLKQTNTNINATVFHLQIGEAGKLKPLEVDLKRLEDLSDSIVQDFAAMRKREEEMRSTNGKILKKNILI